MIYVILTYLFSPLLYLLIAGKKKKAASRILIIQTAKIGDVICSTPVLREIKKKYPGISLVVMANDLTRELLEVNPFVDEVVPVNPDAYRGFFGKVRLANIIRMQQCDIVLCLNPNVPFALAAFWGLAPVRISIMPNFRGFTFTMASLFFTYLEKHQKGTLLMETYLHMLKAIGIESVDLTTEVFKGVGADQKVDHLLKRTTQHLIGIAVSSGNKLKELGTEKIAGIVNMLLERSEGCIVLIGSESDRVLANKVLTSVSRRDRVIDTTGILSLTELPALLERLSLFIGVDTGITYMADALRVPIIHLAGPVDVSQQRPLGNVAMVRHTLSCVPCMFAFKTPYACRQSTRECISAITPEEVTAAAERIFLNRQQSVSAGGNDRPVEQSVLNSGAGHHPNFDAFC